MNKPMHFTKKYSILLAFALVFHLSACSTAPDIAQTTHQPVSSQTVETSTTTSPPQTGCPAEKPEISPQFEYPQGGSESIERFFTQILDFLNAGGTRQAVITAYHQEYPQTDQGFIQEKDVTADGIPELLLTEDASFGAFVCLNGQYQINWLVGETYHFTRPRITKIIDMNQNGLDEIISSHGDMRFQIVYVSEWDGDGFSILNDVELPTYYEDQPCSVLMGSSKVSTPDTDNNGTLELILDQGIPTWSEYSMGMPWRKETRICTWNGRRFTPDKIEITDPPHYRFQAVQDADRAALLGNYTKALDLYQQAISNNTLDWWSQDRRIYEINLPDAERVYNPTPLPSMLPDPAEYPMLAAYAHFRIMLLHTVLGNLPEAQVVYATLQENFPVRQTGHVQAEMASAFWLEYQASKNIEKACAKAIEYSTLHPADVLSYLGNGTYNTTTSYGYQSLEYNPEDVCPFR